MIKSVFIFLLLPVIGLGQLPETDIWLFKIEKKEGKFIYTNPLNINNRPGYDNQPVFAPDGKSVIYVSIDDSKQADLYQYSISKKTHTNLTKSQVSEYSPTIVPGGSGLSSVVVEKDSAQRVWLFKMDGSFERILHEGTDSIGYHAWLNADTLLYYKLTGPHSLRSLNLKTDNDTWICEHPARAFKKIGSSSKFIYAIKDSTFMQFRIYDPALRESLVYATYPSLNEDFIWHDELGLIKSENADLIRYNAQSNQWETLFSFSGAGIKKITRFTFDSKNKQLIVVNNL